MNNRIYFIGGASASGKSTVAKALSDLYSFPVVELDRFHDILTPAISDRERLVDTTNQIALEAVTRLLDSNAACIIEGGWIQPAQADRLRDRATGRFCPVYCGYPEADIESRYRAIKQDGAHWLNDKSGREARAFLRGQIEDSDYYRRECERLRIDFFDFTDFSEGSSVLHAHFRKWLQGC